MPAQRQRGRVMLLHVPAVGEGGVYPGHQPGPRPHLAPTSSAAIAVCVQFTCFTANMWQAAFCSVPSAM